MEPDLAPVGDRREAMVQLAVKKKEIMISRLGKFLIVHYNEKA